MDADDDPSARTPKPEHARLGYSDLTREALAEIARAEGIDYATSLLHNAVLALPSTRRLIEALRGIPAEATPKKGTHAKALIVPAALYREYPKIGGDGRVIKAAAERLGMDCDLIPLPSAGGVLAGASKLGEAIAAEPPGRDLILVSLSKGCAEARVAFERGHIPAGRVKTWIQIGGLIHGTPLANRLMRGHWWRRAILTGYLAYTRASRELVEELGWGPDYPLRGRAAAPPGARVVNLLAFPLRRHLSGALRARHSRLASLGPNDGATLLLDAIVEPGEILPVWGEGHYFQGPAMGDLMRRLLAHVADSTPAAPPADREVSS